MCLSSPWFGINSYELEQKNEYPSYRNINTYLCTLPRPTYKALLPHFNPNVIDTIFHFAQL